MVRVLACACFAVLVTSANIDAATEEAQMDELFAAWNDTSEKPGLAVAVMRNGKDVYRKYVGLANLEYGIKLSEKSVFDTASVAKQFTGFAVATLIEDGKLRMEDPIRKYLPELNELHDPIKVRHLAHHTSGLRDVANLFDLGSFGHMSTATQALDLIKVQKGFNFEAGTEYDYSNSNYVLLALIVERITKQSFRSWCDEHLFKPLGMSNSFANDNPTEIIKNRSVAYYGQDTSFKFEQNNGMAMVGSSAVYSTLADMQVWMRHLATTKSSSKVTQRMLTTGELDSGEPIDYGLGLAVHPYRGIKMVEHSGATPSGFRTQVALFLDHDLAFVVLSNWGDVDVLEEYGKRIIEIYLGEQLDKEGSNKEGSDRESGEVKTVELPKETLAKFAGNYLFNDEANVVCTVEGAELKLDLEGRGKVKVQAVSPTRFYIEELRSFMQFEDDSFQAATVFEGDKKIGQLKRKRNDNKKAPDTKQLVGRYFNDELNLVFTVEKVDGGALTLNTSATKAHELVHRSDEKFRAVDWSFTKVNFTRSSGGSVDRLELAAGNRLRSITFQRMK